MWQLFENEQLTVQKLSDSMVEVITYKKEQLTHQNEQLTHKNEQLSLKM